MIDKISKLNNEFNKSFPEVYLKPSKVNKFLRKYSNEVERKIKKRIHQKLISGKVNFMVSMAPCRFSNSLPCFSFCSYNIDNSCWTMVYFPTQIN